MAVDEREVEPLRALEERATANGVPGLQVARAVRAHRGRALRPRRRRAALPRDGDRRLRRGGPRVRGRRDRGAGGQIRTGVAVTRVHQNGRDPGGPSSPTATAIEGDRVIVCAGLQADRLAMASGEPAEPRIVPVPRRVLAAAPRAHAPRARADLPGARSRPAVPRGAPDAQDRRHGRARAQRDPVDGAPRLRAPAVRPARRLRGDQLARNAADAPPPLARRRRRDRPLGLQAPVRPRGRALRPGGRSRRTCCRRRPACGRRRSTATARWSTTSASGSTAA